MPKILTNMATVEYPNPLIRHLSAGNSRRTDLSYREHMDIIRCFRTGDLDASLDSLRKHLESVARSAVDVAKIEGFSAESF